MPEERVNGDGEKKTEGKAGGTGRNDGLGQRSLLCHEQEECLSCNENGNLGPEDHTCEGEKIERYPLMCFGY